MTRLVDIAKKVKEQERYESALPTQVSLQSIERPREVTTPFQTGTFPSIGAEESSVSRSVQVVEKIVYVRKDPKTRLDQNFNVRLPGNLISLLKRKFGDRGATVFCRLAILERIKNVFDESELREIGFFQLLEEQYMMLSKLKDGGG